MTSLPVPCSTGAGLPLADGARWSIAGIGGEAAAVAARLGEVLQMKPLHRPPSRLLLLFDGNSPGKTDSAPDFPYAELPDLAREAIPAKLEDGGKVVGCSLKVNSDMRNQLMRACRAISWHTELDGGLLLHGALAEWQGRGVVLAGPSSVGKTTASKRLPSPWRSLCDDHVLIVRDELLRYRAHPWPTWSNFLEQRQPLNWDTAYSVPLAGIFFLCQSPFERVDPLKAGQAVCLLVESVEQAWMGVDPKKCAGEVRALRLRRFANISETVRSVPCHVLHLSLSGEFWREIERKIHEASQ